MAASKRKGLDLKAHIRDIPDFPKPGILFRDITPLLQTPKAFRAAINAFAARYKDKRLDKIMCVESRGFLFGAPLAAKLGVGLAIVRKPGKLPWKTRSVQYALEYGTDVIEIHEDAILPGERVLIIDDLLATGGTAAAGVQLVREHQAKVIECAFVIELKALGGRKRLAPVKTYSVIQY
ncbi:MAG: adenine phosphoribosyltransferase [bacterium]